MADKRKNPLSLKRRANLHGYVFVLPFIIGLLCVFFPMVFDTVRLSFVNLSMDEGGYILDLAGFKHYNWILFVDPNYIRQLVGSLSELFINTAVILIYALFIATLLSRELKGRGIIRTVMFLPVIIATGIINQADAISVSILDSGSGALAASPGEQGIFDSFDIQSLIMSLKLSDGLIEIIVGVVNNLYGIITKSGVQMLIFLAGLQSISPAIYESATVEGATWWESFWKITFPMVSPLLIVNTVYTVVDSFTSFSNVLMSRIYKLIIDGSYPVASSMSILYFIVMALLLVVVILVMNRLVFYENR